MKTSQIESNYTPENLSLWETPESWYGQPWDGYYVFLRQNRDSDCLTRSNFRCAIAELGGETEDDEGEPLVAIVREGHWTVGWIEWIAIRADQTEVLRKADAMAGKLDGYPVLNDEDLSDLEAEEANEVWKKCYSAKDRIAYIRENSSHFDFQDWRDLLSCVRGEYFAGYASEFLY